MTKKELNELLAFTSSSRDDWGMRYAHPTSAYGKAGLFATDGRMLAFLPCTWTAGPVPRKGAPAWGTPDPRRNRQEAHHTGRSASGEAQRWTVEAVTDATQVAEYAAYKPRSVVDTSVPRTAATAAAAEVWSAFVTEAHESVARFEAEAATWKPRDRRYRSQVGLPVRIGGSIVRCFCARFVVKACAFVGRTDVRVHVEDDAPMTIEAASGRLVIIAPLRTC